MQGANIKIKKIHNFMVHNTVDQVAYGPAEQQYQTGKRDFMVAGCLKIKNQNRKYCNYGKNNENWNFNIRGVGCKYPKRHSGISNMRQGKKILNNG